MRARRRGGAGLLTWMALGCAALAGCDTAKGGSSDEVTIVVQGDRHELELQERSIKERESALRAEQEKLDKRQAELDRVRAAADVEQARRIEEEMLRLRTEQGQLAVKLNATEAQKTEVAARKSALEVPTAQLALSELSAREAGVASREARLSAREVELAQREKELAQRESRLLAVAEKVASAEKAAPAAADGSDRGAREVPKAQAIEARHRKLLEDLDARGVLIADLQPEDQPLNSEIWSARKRGDFAHAADLLVELSSAVKRLKVDQRFVEQKMLRLQGQRGGTRLAERQRGEVERLLREVTSAYSDGRYESANKGLNRIAAILDAGRAAG